MNNLNLNIAGISFFTVIIQFSYGKVDKKLFKHYCVNITVLKLKYNKFMEGNQYEL